MRTQTVMVATSIGALSGLPKGTRIATNHNKLLVLEEAYGKRYWFEEGELTPYEPLVHWLPAFVLPPVVDHKADEEAEEFTRAKTVIHRVLGTND